MWKGRGRSGYGEATLQGDYDDWTGVSRNGRQYKNPATMLTSNYSGADYWHARKQITDTYDVPESMHAVNDTISLAHCLPNGKANLLAYADKVLPVKKSSVSIEDKILPQAARLRRLTEQLIELEQAKKAGMNIDKYSKLRDVLIVKRTRCEVLLQKALAVKPPIQEDEDSLHFDDQYTQDSVENASQNNVHNRVDDSHAPEWLKGIRDTNSLKKPLIKACQTYKTLVRWAIKTKQYINELKAL